MTLSLSADAFDADRGLAHLRRRPAARAGRERAVSVAITLAAHLLVAAGLLYGIEVARAPQAEKPIVVDVIKDQKKPDDKPLALPKFAPPQQVTLPPPQIEIAAPPPPNAITATPPRPAAPPQPPAPASPAPVATPWSGQANYYAGLLAYLDRFKQYPSAARAAHIEGEVFVHFVMTRDGVVQSAEIARSSGRPALDREALAMIQRAGRLPPMPVEMKGDKLDAIIGPITFALH